MAKRRRGCAQVFCYDGRLMKWHAASQLGSGHTADVGWASTAGGLAAEFVATASATTAHIWELKGRFNQLQVQWHVLLVL